MKIKNNVGPKIDPWGTPDFIYAGFHNSIQYVYIACPPALLYDSSAFKTIHNLSYYS